MTTVMILQIVYCTARLPFASLYYKLINGVAANNKGIIMKLIIGLIDGLLTQCWQQQGHYMFSICIHHFRTSKIRS